MSSMASINKVFLIGRLGKDPEVKYSEAGNPLCSMTLATDSSYKDRDGDVQKNTDWHRIVCFGKTAENCGKYLRKGSQVHVEGAIRYRSWEKDGQKHSITEIIAQNVTFLDSKQREGGEAPARVNSDDRGGYAPRNDSYGYGAPRQNKMDDVPF